MDFPRTAAGRFKPWTFMGLVTIHLLALLVFIPAFFSWWGVVLFFFMWWLTASLGVSLAYHRMLTHGSCKAKPGLKYFLVSCACQALEMGPIDWPATHRLHHRESDHEDDPHSPLVVPVDNVQQEPQTDFWWAHILWLFYDNNRLDTPEKVADLVPDLVKDPVLVFMNKYFVWFWIVSTLLIFGIGYLAGGLLLACSLVVWGVFFRTVWVWHWTWFVNSATHLWGYRNHNTSDDSRNLWWVALFTFGEGWHNNHHALQGKALFGEKWWELDPTYWVILLFKALGWISGVNTGEAAAKNPSRSLTGKVAATSRALKSALRPQIPSKAVE